MNENNNLNEINKLNNFNINGYPGKGLGIASMVLGIVSVSCFCCITYLSCVTAIVGIILGAVGNSQSKQAGYKNNMAVAGIVLGIIACSIFLIILLIGGGASLISLISEA